MQMGRLGGLIPRLILSCTFALGAAPAFAAAVNNTPPPGAILDLAGGETGTPAQTINHGTPVTEAVNFKAGLTMTDITLAFRDDPAFISLSDVSLVDLTHPSRNLIANGQFALGRYTSGGNSSAPLDWTYHNVYGAPFDGAVSHGCSAFVGSTCWYDGSTQAYDAVDQDVATIVGDVYTLSFAYTENGSQSTFSDLSRNGATGTAGNGIDILAYAQAGLPTPAPEPVSIAVFSAGLFGLGVARRRTRR